MPFDACCPECKMPGCLCGWLRLLIQGGTWWSQQRQWPQLLVVTLWDRRYCVCEENEGKRMLFCPPCVVFCVMSLGRGAQTNALACDSCTTSFEQTTRLKKHVGLSFSWRPELLSSLRRGWLPSSLGTGVSRGGALSCFVSWNRPQLSALVTWRDYFWYPMCRCQCSQGLEGNQVQVH